MVVELGNAGYPAVHDHPMITIVSNRPIFRPANLNRRQSGVSATAMTKLTAATRKKIPTGDFALPGRRYPVEDEAHARNALARVSQDGTPAEKAAVRRKVSRRFPGLKQEG